MQLQSVIRSVTTMRPFRTVWIVALAAVVVLAAISVAFFAFKPRHNLIIFVADGLRYEAVNPTDAPAMSAVRAEGVDFINSHSMLPTITTPNASAIATGHGIGDTGDFANSVWLGPRPIPSSPTSLITSIEDDPGQKDANARFGGNYLGEQTLLATLRKAGYLTASVGKDGPVGILDVTARDGSTIVIDDETGTPEGIPVQAEIKAAIQAKGLSFPMPDRGLNGYSGAFNAPGVQAANTDQQDWLAKVVTEVLLPRFKAQNKPFALVFWSRDPDGTQHGQGDSLNTLVPGINGPTTAKAVRNADNDLAALRASLVKLGLDKTTDIIVTADHGFSTISRQSVSSPAAKADYGDVPKGFLPPGFLALDLGKALNLKVWEPNGLDMNVMAHPRSGSALIGPDPAHPRIALAANGGVDMLWLPDEAGKRALAEQVVAALVAQDYTAAVFVKTTFGGIPGTLPLADIGFDGSARTPAPDIVVSFRSYLIPGCLAKSPLLCAAEVADTSLQQGQGIHGGFSRANTRNMMAAIGPDFRRKFVDPAPVANTDWAPTVARALGVSMPSVGKLGGRPILEALKDGPEPPKVERRRIVSKFGPNGFVTALDIQTVGRWIYRDQASRTVGFQP